MPNNPNESVPFFRGYEGFEEVLRDRRLARPGRAFRVYNYGGPSKEEKIYVLGTGGQLFDPVGGKKVEAVNVFSREAAPDGWSVEGLELFLLPQEELDKIIANPELTK